MVGVLGRNVGGERKKGGKHKLGLSLLLLQLFGEIMVRAPASPGAPTSTLLLPPPLDLGDDNQ